MSELADEELALIELKKATDDLFASAKTQEERNEVWRFILEHIHEISDDDEWASFRKRLDEAMAKKGAH